MNFSQTQKILALAQRIDGLNRAIGHGVSWLIVLMVVIQFVVVIMRYVFSIGSVAMQESIWYLHGLVFLIGAGYTLLVDGHVRVDVFYREASVRTRAIIDLIGSVVLIIPFCLCVFIMSWGYVINSWEVLETSADLGIPAIFLLKTVIWVFAILLGLQAISMSIRAYAYIAGQSSHYGSIAPPEQDHDKDA